MSLLALLAASGVTPAPTEWPPTFGEPELLLPLGPPGTWDASDINNPNVQFDPATQRWFIQYTGHLHTTTGDPQFDEQQKSGYAWSNTLDGPWMKDPANPVYAEVPPTWYGQNGGIVQLQDGTWLYSYTSMGGRTRFAKSPDLYTWTNVPNAEFHSTWDSFLRLKPDGRVECIYTAPSDGLDPFGRPTIRTCRRALSSDGGLTWTHTGVVAYAPEFVYDGPGWGEQTIWHMPGYEDERMLLLSDANLTPGGSGARVRANVMGRTLDGGETWDWHVINEATNIPGDWAQVSVFDTFPVIHGGKFYLFYCGAKILTNLLDGDLQIGVRVADWYDAWMTP